MDPVPPKALLFGLLVQCPFDEGALQNCPLSDVRSLPSLRDRYYYVQELGDEDFLRILMEHQLCADKRQFGVMKV